MTNLDNITIRRATAADAGAIDRLAGLDSKHLPRDDFLLAEVAGEPWAAVGIGSDVVAADPFRATAELTELLRTRAARLRAAPTAPRPARRLRRRLRATT